MKKKSPRGIPDFAPKRPGFSQIPKTAKEKPTGAAVTAPKIKPQSTAAKGNRRGQ
jgi:hypothetical protein